jgi:imidazole glycerol phosphate synthase glutamine amidotransferase subunit
MAFPIVRIVVAGSPQSGVGNVRSVTRALERSVELGGMKARTAEIVVAHDPEIVRSADYVVVPGQGAFGPFARGIEGGLGDALREHIAKERPYLGICLGMQVLFESSDEAPGAMGLGVLEGHVKRLEPGIDPATARPYPLPHIGWNTVETKRQGERYFYFAHSYAVVPADPSIVSGTTTYGSTRFATTIRRGKIIGVQFHPEKSQREGLKLLAGFFRM